MYILILRQASSLREQNTCSSDQHNFSRDEKPKMALNYYRQGRQVAERNEEDNKVILYHYFAVHYKNNI